MKGKQIVLLVVVALALTGLLAQTALAASQTIEGITFNGPDTRAQCIDAPSSDTITITGLTGHKPAASVEGTVDVAFVTNAGAGRQLIKSYPVQSNKNVSLKVQYPPVSQWPPNGDPNAHEIHVDVRINVLVDGKIVGTFDGNPNLGWDVYCTTQVISPTATKVKAGQTQTATRTATILVKQGNTVTPTKTEKPDNSGGGGGGGDGSTPQAASTPVVGVASTPAAPAPVVAPTTGGTAEASMSALAMIMLIGLGLLGAGWALRRAIR